MIFVAALDCRYRTAVGTQALACLKTALPFLHQTSPAALHHTFGEKLWQLQSQAEFGLH